MTRIKSMNGYTIYQAGARDVIKHGFEDGSFYVYFSTDLRDFGLSNSTPEYEGCGSIEEAEANCCGNFARAKELVENQTTAASFEEITEIERRLDAGETVEDIEDGLADLTSDENEEPDTPVRKTRLQRELSGELGDNWKRHAENEIAKAAEDLRSGSLMVDVDGVVRNCIGRVIMDDMAELLEAAGCTFSRSATTRARDLEISAELAAYRANPPAITDDDLAEMRATFGTGTTVVDALSGRRVSL